jgi:hypothetical protein
MVATYSGLGIASEPASTPAGGARPWQCAADAPPSTPAASSATAFQRHRAGSAARCAVVLKGPPGGNQQPLPVSRRHHEQAQS